MICRPSGHHQLSRVSLKLSATPLFLALGLLAGEAHAQDHVTVDPADVVELEKFSACRRLKNNAANPVFIPMRTAEEWVTGTKSFLSKTPSNIRKGPCIDYALDAKVWGRVGPPGSVWPHVIDAGDAGVTTLSSVGAAVGGGTATQSGDRILYNPGTDFKDKGYLATTRVTVPWAGVDFEGVLENGTSQIDVVGYWEGTKSYFFAENPPEQASTWYLQDLSSPVTMEEARAASVVGYRALSFDGDHVSYGIHQTKYTINWVILIDNSIKTRSAYSLGAAPGNPNGDSYSNTMLDAQINAASDFIDAIYAWDVELGVGQTITSTDGSTITLAGDTDPDNGAVVNIFTINSGLQFVGSGKAGSSTGVAGLKSLLTGIRHNAASWVDFNAALTSLDTSHAANLTGTNVGSTSAVDFVNVIVLSPGPSDRASFATIFNKLNGTSAAQSSQWGFEFFAFRSAGQNDLIDAADSSGVATALTSVTSIRNRSIPHPVRISDYIFAFWNTATSTWDLLKDGSGADRIFGLTLIKERPNYVYQGNTLQFSSRGTWVCRTKRCEWDKMTPDKIVNEGRFETDRGKSTDVIVEFKYVMRPGYKAYKTRFASRYNSGSAVYKGLSYVVPGDYTPSPP